jgi:hypothetical protein
MGRIQPPGYGQRKLYVYSNPMTKHHPGFCHVIAQSDVPFRQIVNKNCPSRFYDPNTLIQPLLTPGDVFIIRPVIVYAITIDFGKIKGRISKYGVYRFIMYMWKESLNITFKQQAARGGIGDFVFDYRIKDYIWVPYSLVF